MTKKLLFLLLGWALSAWLSVLMAQPALYLKPSLSGQFGMYRHDRAIGKSSRFHTGSPNIELGGGGDLQLKINPQYALSIGLHINNYGFGYRVDVLGYGRKSGDNSDYYYSIPVLLHYTLANDVHWIGLDKVKYNYLFVFRLYGVAGLSYNNVRQRGYYGQLTITGSPMNITGREPTVYQRNNVSAYLGVGMQFYNGQKDRFDVRIYLTRGFGKIAYQDYQYSFIGEPQVYQTRFWSRGSLIAFSVSYPIKLMSFKRDLP